MSIRRVNCPGCNATLNVPATMSSIKCSACGTIWDVNNPNTAQRAASNKAPRQSSDDVESPSIPSTPVIAAIVGGLLLLTIVIGVSFVVFSGGKPDSDNDKPAASKSSSTNASAANDPTTPTSDSVETEPNYRIVKLPESTRKKIYADYKALAKTSIDKQLKIPKNSFARQSLDATLQGIVDREIQRFAALHSVSDDDIRQIIAEGNAKAW